MTGWCVVSRRIVRRFFFVGCPSMVPAMAICARAVTLVYLQCATDVVSRQYRTTVSRFCTTATPIPQANKAKAPARIQSYMAFSFCCCYLENK